MWIIFIRHFQINIFFFFCTSRDGCFEAQSVCPVEWDKVQHQFSWYIRGTHAGRTVVGYLCTVHGQNFVYM